MHVLGTRVADRNFYLAQGSRYLRCYGCFSALREKEKGTVGKKYIRDMEKLY